MTPMNLALLSSLACDLEPVLRGKLTPPWNLVRLPDVATPDEIAAALREADAELTLRYDRKLPAPRLRFLPVAGAGSPRWPAISTGSRAAKRCATSSIAPCDAAAGPRQQAG